MVSPERGYVFHNRLTHSLKVGQLARTIADLFGDKYATRLDRLGAIDPDVAEAAGLAHDLGHPPFGHIAEKELDRLVVAAGDPDGFEGNAQSFRIVSRLATGDPENKEGDRIAGLNLTRETLAGITKYPWARGVNEKRPEKWGYYNAESDFFEFAHAGRPPFQRSVVAEIMDWSDDVT